MKLSYKNIFPWGEPTRFREKILLSMEFPESITENRQVGPVVDITLKPKIHTFRNDSKNRWPPLTGLIHHTYFNRMPNEDIFAITPCTGTQKAQIHYKDNQIQIRIDGKLYCTHPRPGHQCSVKFEDIQRMREIAVNDGFESPEQFFKWFSEDWSGKIIHWTGKRYK